MRYKVLVVDTTVSEKYDLIVGRYKQRANTPEEAEALVREREFRGRSCDGLNFYVYV